MKKPLKYVSQRFARGHLYWYFRRGETFTRLPGGFGSAEFLARYYELKNDGSRAPAAGAYGTVAALVSSHTRSPYWTQKIGDESRRTQMTVLNRFSREHGAMPVKPISPENIETMMAKLTTLYARRNWLIAVKPLMKHAVEIGLLKKNPCDGIKVALPGGDGFTAWTDVEIGLYRARHPIGTMPRLAIELLLNTMARSGDAIRLGPGNRWGGRIVWNQRKAKNRKDPTVSIGMLPEFELAFQAMPPAPGATTLLRNSAGEPFRANAWHKAFAKWVKEAGIPDEFRAHGLRKAAIIRLAYAGATDAEIEACSGHAGLQMVRLYRAQANRERLSDQATARLLAAR